MKPNLIVVAGPNGAGKTTITEKLLRHKLRHKWMEGCVYINPDVIAQEKFGGAPCIIQCAMELRLNN